MDKMFAPYMTYGKMVKSHWTDNVFKLIENMDKTADFVRGVAVEHWGRYQTLKAWEQNWKTNSGGFRERFTGDIEEVEQERISYETELKISDVSPENKVRFITPDYKAKFEVKDFGRVKVNGEVRRVAYIDDYHFYFLDRKTGRAGGCYHICEFAELCESRGIDIQPIGK